MMFVVKHVCVLNEHLNDTDRLNCTYMHAYINYINCNCLMLFSIFFTKPFLLSFFIRAQLALNDLCNRPGVNIKTFSSCNTCTTVFKSFPNDGTGLNTV